MSGGFFRGTSAEQDTRFSNKQAKLLKTQKFAPELEHLVDMSKVKMDVIKPWIAKRVTELLDGFEDEVLINFIYGLLEGKEVNGKQVQIQLTGFMEKNTGKFMKELWALLVSAQKNASGVPQQFLDAKEEETRKKKVENDRIFDEIQRRKEKEAKESEPQKERQMDDGLGDNSTERSNRRRKGGPGGQSGDEYRSDVRNGSRERPRASKSPPDQSQSPHRERSISRSVSGSPMAKQGSISPERTHQSPRRSFTPRRRSARESVSPRRSSLSRRRSSSRTRYRSPSPRRRRIRSPVRRRSPSPLRRCSPSPLRRRSPPRRRRSPSPWRRRSPSPGRRRSPIPVRRRRRSTSSPRSQSPGQRRSPSPVQRRFQSPARRPYPSRRRTPSPALARSRSPSRRRSPLPRGRRSPSLVENRSVQRTSDVPARKGSPTPLPSRSPSPGSQSSGSPVRRSSASPVKMRSPRLQKSSYGSPGERTRNHEPVRRQPISLSPQRDHSNRKPSQKKVPSVSPPPEKSYAESPQIRNRISGEDRRLASSPYDDPGKKSGDKMSLNGGQSLTRLRDQRVHHGSTEKSEEKFENKRETGDKYKLEERKSSLSLSGKQKLSPVQTTSHQLCVGVNARENNQTMSEEASRKEVHAQQNQHHKGSVLGEKSDVLYPGEVSKLDEKRNSQLTNARDNTMSDSLVKLHKKRRSPSVDSDSGSEESEKRRGDVSGKKKHRRSKRREVASDDTSSESEMEDRTEAKRRKKEEKKLRKEERRRRREERRKRKEEKRVSKRKRRSKDADGMSSDLDKIEKDDNASNGKHRSKKYSSGEEETESQKKRLEIELRAKALESLRAKKGISR